MREYAIDLLRDGTEAVDAPAARPAATRRPSSQNPLGLGLLLGVVGVPLTIIFTPLGIGLIVVAGVMCLVGIGMIVIRR